MPSTRLVAIHGVLQKLDSGPALAQALRHVLLADHEFDCVGNIRQILSVANISKQTNDIKSFKRTLLMAVAPMQMPSRGSDTVKLLAELFGSKAKPMRKEL